MNEVYIESDESKEIETETHEDVHGEVVYFSELVRVPHNKEEAK